MTKQEGYRAVLKNRPFLALWIAQIFSQLGDRVCFVVFVAIIAANIGDSSTYQSWLYVAFTIPAIFLTAIAGVFVDRWNKKYTLIVTNILRGGLIVLLPFIDTSLMGIYLLAFMISAVTQFFVPTEASCIPMLVDKKQLLDANSLFTTTMMGSVIFGFVLGDPLINLFGIDMVHFAITALFIISAISLFWVVEKREDHDHDRTVREFFDELKEGFDYIRKTPIVFNAIMKLAVLFSIIVALSILSITISSDILYVHNPVLGAQKFGYIVAYSGLGMVIGSFIVVKILRKKAKYFLIFTGFTLIGLSLIFLALTSSIPQDIGVHLKVLDGFFLTLRMVYTYLMAALVGFGASLVAIPVQTILQISIPESIRGKVFGVQFTLLSTASTLPVIIAAFGADVIGVSYMLLLIGLPLLLFGVYNFYKLRLKLRRNKKEV